jgi:uncharacterized protein YqfA (UPF0365 family)
MSSILCLLVGDHLLLRDFGHYGIFIVCVIIVVMAMLFFDFVPYGIILMTMSMDVRITSFLRMTIKLKLYLPCVAEWP